MFTLATSFFIIFTIVRTLTCNAVESVISVIVNIIVQQQLSKTNEKVYIVTISEAFENDNLKNSGKSKVDIIANIDFVWCSGRTSLERGWTPKYRAI